MDPSLTNGRIWRLWIGVCVEWGRPFGMVHIVEDSKLFEIADESDAVRADEWLRTRYAPDAQPMLMISLVLLQDLLSYAEDAGASRTVSCTAHLARELGTSMDTVQRMMDVYFTPHGGTVRTAMELGRVAGMCK